MLSAVKTSSIVFYAAAAGLALLLAVVFLIVAVRKRRARNGADVLFIIVGTLILLAALAVGAFAVVVRYAPFSLTAAETGEKLRILYNGKVLFSVPFIGKAVTVFAELALIGVIAPFAVAGLALISVITVGAKTYRRKKEKKEKRRLATVAENAAPESEDTVVDERVEPAENTAVDPPAPEESAPSPDIEPEAAKSILDAIDALVDGASVPPAPHDVSEQLRRAIEEGYALADIPNEEPAGLTEDGLTEEEPEEQESEPEDDSELSYESVEEEQPEIVPERRRVRGDDKVIAVDPESITHERHAPAFDERNIASRTRVRTIVRRPAARNIEELTRRAEELEEGRGQERTAVKKSEEPPTPPQKPANARKNAGGKRSATQKNASAKQAQPAAEHKNVTAEENNLPLTRKYIILNRRNAAAVFNEYLNSKRAQEKDELTGSLNTIIMK
ncbi:MAG: hypothetical protein K2L51_05800 [Clostridiales bacterium]|nr:hypothetical protein [Clostridiales bacterium]